MKRKACKCKLREKELRCPFNNASDTDLDFFCGHDPCGGQATTIRFGKPVTACFARALKTHCPRIKKVFLFDQTMCKKDCFCTGADLDVRIAKEYDVQGDPCVWYESVITAGFNGSMSHVINDFHKSTILTLINFSFSLSLFTNPNNLHDIITISETVLYGVL